MPNKVDRSFGKRNKLIFTWYDSIVGEIVESVLWSIKYRPTAWADFIGKDNTISQLKSLVDSSVFSNMIFYGPAGTGKTAAAELFSKEILGDSYGANFKILNIRDVWDIPISKSKRSVQDLAKLGREERSELDEYMSVVFREAKLARKARGRSGDPTRRELLSEAIRFFASTATVTDEKVKILILDEADAMTWSMQQGLRRTMELFSDTCRFIIITPSLSGWSPAIISRSLTLHFPNHPADIVQKLILEIAAKENVVIDDSAAAAIARESEGDLRRAINLLQTVSNASDSVTEDIVYEYSETQLVVRARNIVTLALDGQFQPARKEMRNLIAIDGYSPQEVCLEIERDLVKRPFTPEVLSKVLDRVAEIDYRLLQGKNAFVHLAALLASLQAIAIEES
ncbi:MAG: AAA family ATPase [Candidatus Thorarchaeota archaeon]